MQGVNLKNFIHSLRVYGVLVNIQYQILNVTTQ